MSVNQPVKQPADGKSRLKHNIREIAEAKENTARMGSIATGAYKKSLGSEEMPSELANMADVHMGKVNEWAGFTKELFGSMFDPAGMKELPDNKISEVGKELLDVATKQAQFGELRLAARCHSSIAADATKDLAAAVASATGIDKIPDDPEAEKPPEELQQEREKIENIPVDPDDKQGQQDKQEALDLIDQAINKGKARRDAIIEKLGKNGSQLDRAVRAAAAKAQEAAKAVNGLVKCGFGSGAGGGGAESIPPEMIKQAMEMPDFSKILDLVGKMQSATDELEEEALGYGRLNPVGLSVAKEITDVIPGELAEYSSNPLSFLSRFINAEVLGEERENPEPKAKGDLMIFVDRSGSMQGPRIEWARALAVAGIMQAEKNKRRWTVTMFADSSNSLRSSSSVKGLQHALSTVSVGAGGGTNTDWAIRSVLKSTDLQGGLRDPDILLITDGDWEDFSDETKRLLKGKKMRLFVVQLEGMMRKIEAATKVWRIDQLNIASASKILLEVKF